LRELEEIEISRQSCRGDCEQQGGKSFCVDFVQEFGLRTQQGREGYKDFHPVGESSELHILNDQRLLWSYCFFLQRSPYLQYLTGDKSMGFFAHDVSTCLPLTFALPTKSN
jgi:hypothetical protein